MLCAETYHTRSIHRWPLGNSVNGHFIEISNPLVLDLKIFPIEERFEIMTAEKNSRAESVDGEIQSVENLQ